MIIPFFIYVCRNKFKGNIFSLQKYYIELKMYNFAGKPLPVQGIFTQQEGMCYDKAKPRSACVRANGRKKGPYLSLNI